MKHDPERQPKARLVVGMSGASGAIYGIRLLQRLQGTGIETHLIMSRNGVFQAQIAESHGNNYGLALAIVGGAMAVVIAIWTAIGPERKNADFAAEAKAGAT